MTKRDKIIAEKIIIEAALVKRMLAGLNQDIFLINDEKQRAVVMTLLNIGELVKNLSMDFRKNYNAVPWKSIAGLRDVVAHGYFTLRMEEIWVYATDDLPKIAAQINHILENETEKGILP
jgi:uncharacterized protein with HEPN domain